MALTAGMIIQLEFTLLALGYILTFFSGRVYQLVVSRETSAAKPRTVVAPEVELTLSNRQGMSDEDAIDESITVETGENVQEIQLGQRPTRRKKTS